jgi:hypothetical protein
VGHGSRYWMVIDPEGKLGCVTVCKRGAVEVVRRLAPCAGEHHVRGAAPGRGRAAYLSRCR